MRHLFVILLAAAASWWAAPLFEEEAADCRSVAVEVSAGGDAAGGSAADAAALSYGLSYCTGIAVNSCTGADAAPVSVRTLSHHTRPMCRHASCGFMARAIDSSCAAGRYGLYNHKILFAPRSVDHYLHKMCRLVIWSPDGNLRCRLPVACGRACRAAAFARYTIE